MAMSQKELELRKLYVNTAISYLGCNEADGSHRKIIDIYNSHTPLSRGYRVSYNDPWCATYVSAMAILCNLTSIMFTECSCDALISKYKSKGRWVEDDSYVPNIGDHVQYDWQDNGIGDNTGTPDHIGIIVSKKGNTMTVIEGNISNSVGYRKLQINGKYIRGYCCPDFASLATGKTSSVPVIDSNKVTNTATSNTPTNMFTINLPTLRRGSKGDSVRALQILLIGNNCSCGSSKDDGEFGSGTESAVRKYQKEKGLTVDGVAGKDTWSCLLGLK